MTYLIALLASALERPFTEIRQMSRYQIFKILFWPKGERGQLLPPDPDPDRPNRLEALCLKRGFPRWYWPIAIRKYQKAGARAW